MKKKHIPVVAAFVVVTALMSSGAANANPYAAPFGSVNQPSYIGPSPTTIAKQAGPSDAVFAVMAEEKAKAENSPIASIPSQVTASEGVVDEPLAPGHYDVTTKTPEEAQAITVDPVYATPTQPLVNGAPCTTCTNVNDAKRYQNTDADGCYVSDAPSTGGTAQPCNEELVPVTVPTPPTTVRPLEQKAVVTTVPVTEVPAPRPPPPPTNTTPPSMPKDEGNTTVTVPKNPYCYADAIYC